MTTQSRHLQITIKGRDGRVAVAALADCADPRFAKRRKWTLKWRRGTVCDVELGEEREDHVEVCQAPLQKNRNAQKSHLEPRISLKIAITIASPEFGTNGNNNGNNGSSNTRQQVTMAAATQ